MRVPFGNVDGSFGPMMRVGPVSILKFAVKVAGAEPPAIVRVGWGAPVISAQPENANVDPGMGVCGLGTDTVWGMPGTHWRAQGVGQEEPSIVTVIP